MLEENRNKRVLIETWGCQMNVADSETMLTMLQNDHYTLTDSEEEADLILLNTCHIREKAKHKVLSRLGKLKELKDKNPAMRIAVAGCVAQAEGKKLLKEAPQIDVVLGPGKLQELTTLLKARDEQGERGIALGFSREGVPEIAPDLQIQGKSSLTGRKEVSRFVNIAQGCDNFCTFCVVPFTRGREISRLPQDILSECQTLINQGAVELTLLGQNVNSFGSDLVRDQKISGSAKGPFVDLLLAVCQIPGLERLRFTTSNPHDFTLPLANAFAEQEKLGKYIHLPVQSGNNEILDRMRRKVTVSEYLEKINWLRSIDPYFAISTDLIVGFPGETEEQFEDTIKLVQEVRYSFIYSFIYSSRKNTAAARFTNQLPEEEKYRRLQHLIAVQDKITLEQNLAEVGHERDVLFLYESKKRPGSFYGRTQHLRLTRVDSTRNLVGERHSVKIVDANKVALVGTLI